jgi:hypothetical protein
MPRAIFRHPAPHPVLPMGHARKHVQNAARALSAANVATAPAGVQSAQKARIARTPAQRVAVAADAATESRGNAEGQSREPREGSRNGRGGRNGRGPRQQDGDTRGANGEARQTQLGFVDGEANPPREAGQETQTTEGAASPSAGPEAKTANHAKNAAAIAMVVNARPRGERSEREERPDLRIPAQSGTAETGATRTVRARIPTGCR